MHQGASQGVGLRELVLGIRHNMFLIAIAALAAGFIAWGIGILIPPKYEAEGLLVIETQEFNIPELQALRSSRTVEPWGGRSEARILTSPDLIRQTVEDLALVFDPSFNPSLRKGVLSVLLKVDWLPQALRDFIEGRMPEPDVSAQMTAEIVDDIGDNLNATSEERSYAIGLNYSGLDPQSTALLVNALMERYLANEIEAKRGPALRAKAELETRVDQLFADLERTRQQIRRMEAQGELLTTGSDTIRAQELAEIAAERRQLASQRLQVSGELEQIRAGQRAQQFTVPANRETPRLISLWGAEADLRRSMAEREVELGPNHPVIVSLRRELAENQADIRSEVDVIARGIERQLSSLAVRDQQLAARVDAARSNAVVSAEGRSVLVQLRAEEASKLALYDEYRERYEQTLTSEDLFSADARIVSRAAPAHKPSSPPPALLAIAGLMIGAMGAVGWVVGQQYLSDGVHTLQEAGQISGLPALGGIPRVGSFFGGEYKVAEHVAANPRSAVTETVRGILFRIQHPEMGSTPPKVVMVTSPMPGDGKSSLVTSMARVAARDGLRVLAIDCDFRKPSLDTAIGVTPRWWLNDFLDGSLEVGDAMIQDSRGTAHFLLSKPVVNCSRQFLEQEPLRQMIAASRDFYDLILIDSPPIMKVVDPLILSRQADATVMVVSWREVSRELIKESIERLETTSTPLLGIVMSRVGGKVPENYVYGGYGESI